MDLFPKYIVEDDCLIIGKVSYHKELATDKTKVKGGGWFRWDNEGSKRILILYGSSNDFGKASLNDVKICVEAGKVFTDKFQINELPNEIGILYDTGTELIKLR